MTRPYPIIFGPASSLSLNGSSPRQGFSAPINTQRQSTRGFALLDQHCSNIYSRAISFHSVVTCSITARSRFQNPGQTELPAEIKNNQQLSNCLPPQLLPAGWAHCTPDPHVLSPSLCKCTEGMSGSIFMSKKSPRHLGKLFIQESE